MFGRSGMLDSDGAVGRPMAFHDVSRDGSQIEVLLGSTGGFDPKNDSREVPGKISSRETNFREFLPGK